MKKFYALIMVLVLLFSFAGCNAQTDSDTNPTENAPASTINPQALDLVSDSSSPDRWYLQGTDDIVYIYFTVENDVCSYNLVRSGVVKESAQCVVSDDNHLVSAQNSDFSVDFVFENSCDMYDYKTNSTYSRGDEALILAQLKDHRFADENDSENVITLNGDGTCTKTNAYSGTYALASPSKLVLTFKSSLDTSTETDTHICDVTYNDDKTIRSIQCDGTVYYREISEDETINKYLT